MNSKLENIARNKIARNNNKSNKISNIDSICKGI